MEWFVKAFGGHYLELYRHRDAEEAAACVEVFNRLRPIGTGPVLDLGCGAGRHLPFLSGMGTAGVGLDLSAPLLAEAARSDAEGFDLVRGDMRGLPLRTASVTAVLSLFTAFGYFGRLSEHGAMLDEISRVLAPERCWYLDYLNCSRVRSELGAVGVSRREREMGPCLVAETRRLDDSGERVLKDVVLSPLPGREAEAAGMGIAAAGLSYTEQVALFAVEDLDDMARRRGLIRVAAAGGYDGSPLQPADSQRWLLVYERCAGEDDRE